MKNKKSIILLSILAIVFVSIAVGVTYAFFNYTRTGLANNLGTGRIYFNSTQNGTIQLTNFFPMTSVEAGSANLDTVTVSVTGDTTYSGGEEFLVSIDDVNNTINNKKVPLNFIASADNIGSSSDTYYTSRGGNTAIYTLINTGSVREESKVLVGYIPSGATGVNGSVTIKAYIDYNRIAITDTIENGNIAVPGYDNGTDNNWINGRTVFTTDEWNSIQGNSSVSFKIRVESNEGIWVNEIPTIDEMCPNCVFTYTDSSNIFYTTWNTLGETPTVLTGSDYQEDYENVILSTGYNQFLGVILNSDNKITRAFSCGVYNNVPFCLEENSSNSTLTSNKDYISKVYTGIECMDLPTVYMCNGNPGVVHNISNPMVQVGRGSSYCYVTGNGKLYCS